MLCGGEALSCNLVSKLLAKGASLWNLYGPTETTIWSSTCRIELEGDLISIGRPIANTQVYVLDEHLQPVPIGVPGELYIGGVGLARGYLHRPELTAERFIPHPFSRVPGARLYRTGDLARYLPDGSLEFLGRRDQQVKVRGFRIELGEIEAGLCQHPAVREAAVLAREDTPGSKRLVAYVVARQEPAPSSSALRSFLQQTLPDYMLPSAFVLLDRLPLTPNGKLDRAALPAPDRPERQTALAAPLSPAEALLADIWAQVLGLEQVGIHDNFFALGGDSILSIQIVARAQQAGVHVSVKQLFQHQTIAELAALAGPAPRLLADQGVVTGPVPLTPIQHWFFEQQLPVLQHWNQAMLLEVPPAWEPALLAEAVQHILWHHDALRLRFRQEASGWRQVNAAAEEQPVVSQITLASLAPAQQQAALEAVATDLQASLDLSVGPLLRVALFDLGAQQPARLLLILHHLVVDGISWRIVLEDLALAYQQLSRGETVVLPPKTTSFQQWAQRLAAYAQSPGIDEERDYWLAAPRRRIRPVPVDYPEGKNSEASTRTVTVELSVEETRALLQEVPEVYGTQINDVLLTALAQAYQAWTGQAWLLVDLEGHGREELFEEVDLSRTVGWFTTVYPVVLSLQDLEAPGEALKSIKEQVRRIPRRGLGYGLLRYLRPDREDAARLQALPQAELSFNYLGQFDQVLPPGSLFRWAPESSGPSHDGGGGRRYLLDITGIITGGRLRLAWSYSAEVYRQRTIEQVAQAYLSALQALIAHCQSPEAGGYTPSDFPQMKLDQKELDELIEELDESIGEHQ